MKRIEKRFKKTFLKFFKGVEREEKKGGKDPPYPPRKFAWW